MSQIVLIVRAVAKPGKADALRQTLLAMVRPTHAEPGEKVYDLYASDTAGRYFFYEVWPSKEALDYHASTDHYKRLSEALPDLLAEPIELNFVTPVS